MNDRQLQEEVRAEVAEICYNALMAHYGSEKVRKLIREIGVGENGKKMSKNTIIVEARETKDKDGFEVGVVCSLSPTVHRWNTSTTAKKTTPAILLEDIDIGIEVAEKKAKIEEEKKAKEQERKLKKIKKDFEQREKEKGK